jgi:hypothetical protein
VAALVELVDAPTDDVSAMGFTDGSISVNENGKTQSVAPSNLHKILTYPLPNETPPGVEEVHAAARTRLLGLRTLVNGNVDLG